MTFRSNRVVVAAAAVALAAVGAAAGAGLYASFDSAGSATTTVVNNVTAPSGRGVPIAATSSLTVTEIYNRTIKGVVDITVGASSADSFGRSGGQSQTGEGSGFVYDSSGNIVTNQHVVDGASTITVRFWNGAKYSARLVGSDPSTDIAVIKVNAPRSLLQPLKLGNSDALQVGSGVVAIGSPFGLQGSVTSGIVSALHRTMTSPNNYTIGNSIQTDAPINHGNSGGPLLNALGQVIGVNAQIQSESGGNDGVGFAVPSNTVRSVTQQIAAGKTVKHAYLGIRVDDATTANGTSTGALAAEITSGTPAARAGLQAGDVIVKIAGFTIKSKEDLTRAISSNQPGDAVSITYKRNGTTHIVKVILANRPTE